MPWQNEKPSRSGVKTLRGSAGQTTAIEVAGEKATLLIQVGPSPRVVNSEVDEFEGGETAEAVDKAVSKMKEVGGAVTSVGSSVKGWCRKCPQWRDIWQNRYLFHCFDLALYMH